MKCLQTAFVSFPVKWRFHFGIYHGFWSPWMRCPILWAHSATHICFHICHFPSLCILSFFWTLPYSICRNLPHVTQCHQVFLPPDICHRYLFTNDIHTTCHAMGILSLLDHWLLQCMVRNSCCFVQLSLNVTRFCHHQPLKRHLSPPYSQHMISSTNCHNLSKPFCNCHHDGGNTSDYQRFIEHGAHYDTEQE